MAYDGLVLTALAAELQTELVGARIDKVQQFTADDIQLVVRANRINRRLLLSANKSFPRVHLTTRFAAQTPAQAPLFCMLLRKHIEGGRITQIVQYMRERILFIDIETYDELGDKAVRRIVVEIMGRHSNIILLDRPDGTIIDATTHLTQSTNRFREVLPGRPYHYPPHIEKLDPYYETEKGFLQKREAEPHTAIHKFLSERYQGISPLFGKEVAYYANQLSSSDAQSQWRIFADLLEQAHTARNPVILRDTQGRMTAFYLFVPRHVSGEVILMPSLNECVDQFYSTRALGDLARAKSANYLRLVRTEYDKARSRTDKFQTLLAASEDAEAWRVAGELLTAYLHEVPRGAKTVTLANFYDDERLLAIELDPAKSPLDNANAYFRKYNKYKRGLVVTAEQLALAQEDTAYLESVLHELEHCRLEDIPAIEAELREAGFLAPEKSARTAKVKAGSNHRSQKSKGNGQKGGAKGQSTRDKPAHATFAASDGTPIWVGRNNRENDHMTFKTAHKSDMWLHVKDAPGSHVIIPVAEPSADALYEAALLAAHFSRQRDSSKVEVDFAPVKQLWRPNRARPGFTLFSGQQTVLVTMADARLNRLLAGPEPASLADMQQTTGLMS